MLSIQTNKFQMNASRAMTENQRALDTSYQRLSSGSRINSAADDSAGLQISNRLSVSIEAGRQVNRNLNDGMSYAQIAEGGLGQISDALYRLRALAVQAQNGINSKSDLKALNTEFQQLKQHIDATAYSTEAFGRLPLVGDDDLKIGDVESIEAVLQNGVSKSLPSGLRSIAYIPAGSEQLEFRLDSYSMDDDLQVFTRSGKHLVGTPLTDGVWTAGGNGIDTEADLKDNFFYPENGYLADASYDGSELNSEGTSSFNGMTFDFGGDKHDASNYIETLTIDHVTEPLIVSVVGSGAFEVVDNWKSIGTGATTGSESYEKGPVNITASINPVSEKDFITMEKTPATVEALGLENSALDPIELAEQALAEIDAALNNVLDKRSYYGAKLNAMQSAQRTINTAVTSSTSARSRITDADYAKETANLVSRQIVQQASTSVLTQANAVPEQILTLLNNTST